MATKFTWVLKKLSNKGQEAIINKYCINCGKLIPEKAKFCPICGENQIHEQDKPQLTETKKEKAQKSAEAISHRNSHLLKNPGSTFRDYTIIRMLNKDAEGIKYIVEKEGREFLLKIFYKTSLSNIENLPILYLSCQLFLPNL